MTGTMEAVEVVVETAATTTIEEILHKAKARRQRRNEETQILSRDKMP